MFPRLPATRNICCGHKFCVLDTKNVSDFVSAQETSWATMCPRLPGPLEPTIMDKSCWHMKISNLFSFLLSPLVKSSLPFLLFQCWKQNKTKQSTKHFTTLLGSVTSEENGVSIKIQNSIVCLKALVSVGFRDCSVGGKKRTMRLFWYRHLVSYLGPNISKIFAKESSYFPRTGNFLENLSSLNINGKPRCPLFLWRTLHLELFTWP